MLDLQSSYFAIENPLRLLDRWLNRPRHHRCVCLNRRQVDVGWSERAERALQQRDSPLIVEVQLYFSCVVKKRVLFHRFAQFESVEVNPRLRIAFRPVASAACDPREFAAAYPAGKNLSQGRAASMVPKTVEIDYRRGSWHGTFGY